MEHTMTSAEREAQAELIIDVAAETLRINDWACVARKWNESKPRFVFTDDDLDESLYR